MNTTEHYTNAFSRKKIVIIGDLVADQFLKGTIARVSREAPVFILRHDETETRCGAAANAAVNVASLGGDPVLIGIVGNDTNGELLVSSLKDNGVKTDDLIIDEKFSTTTKVRVLAGQHYAGKQQVIRIDYENNSAISPSVSDDLLSKLQKAGELADAIVISDYNYGVANNEIAVAAKTIANERRIPLIIDSRFGLESFSGATSATPNLDEFEQLGGADLSDLECDKIRERLGFESLLVTCGNAGMLLLEKNKSPLRFAAVGSLEPVDVTGAGDTVIAAYTLAVASGFSFAEAANIANHAGGIVVMKKGTASVTIDELSTSLNNETSAETAVN